MRGYSKHKGWTLIVPIRDPKTGKSRLKTAEHTALATAIAQDTLTAAAACTSVSRLLLITDDDAWTSSLATAPSPTADIFEVTLQAQPGLNSAVLQGLAAARSAPATPTAVLLGDLPALRPADLEEALAAAADLPRGFVADAQGTGTTLITAHDAADHTPQFGPDSARRHRNHGYVELDVPASSALHVDVDRIEDLQRAASLSLGPVTAAAAERLGLLEAEAAFESAGAAR